MSNDFDFDSGRPRRSVIHDREENYRRRNRYDDFRSPVINIGNNGNNKIMLGVIITLVIIIIGLIIFNIRNSNTSLQSEIDRLTKLEQEQNRKIDSLNQIIPIYEERDVEWRRLDSINTYNLNIQKKKTEEYRRKSEEARRKRIETEKKLKKFKENPPLIERWKLLIDTEKRINE